MIPAASITEWGRRVPWSVVEQVEQDLLLSRLIVEIANDDYLGNELKLGKASFRDDLRPLVASWPDDYDLGGAATLVIERVLGSLEGE